MKWFEAPEIAETLRTVVSKLEFNHINPDRVYCMKTQGAKTRAYARIWSFPKIFQQVLTIDPAYVIEVVSERFDKLNSEDKMKVIIHEILHIPKNFSGSLLPHKYGGKRINKEVEKLYKLL